VAEHPALTSWRCLLAVVLVESGRPEEAHAILDELAPDDFAAIRRDFNYPPSLALLGTVVGRLGDTARAPIVYRLLAPFAERNIVFPVYAPGALGSAHRHLGVLAATEGDDARAATHFERRGCRERAAGGGPPLARTQYEYARLLLRQNRLRIASAPGRVPQPWSLPRAAAWCGSSTSWRS
jgi:hypothetical protein